MDMSINQVAENIIPHIGKSWRISKTKPCKYEAVAKNQNNLQETIVFRFSNQRLVIRGLLPHHRFSFYLKEKLCITVNPKRSGKAAAGDIRRRLLPNLRREIERLRTAEKDYQNQENEGRQKASLLSKFAQEMVFRSCSGKWIIRANGHSLGNLQIRACDSALNEVEVTLRIPFDKIFPLYHFIKGTLNVFKNNS